MSPFLAKKKNKNKEKIRSGFLGEVNAEPVVLRKAFSSGLSIFIVSFPPKLMINDLVLAHKA